MGDDIFCEERRVYVKYGMRGQDRITSGADFLFCNSRRAANCTITGPPSN